MKQVRNKRLKIIRQPKNISLKHTEFSRNTKSRTNIEISCFKNSAPINLKNIRIISQVILSLLKYPAGRISIVFCDDKFISKVNRRFFKKSKATDVISFPLQDVFTPGYLGEIIISVEQAKKMCRLYRKKWQEELIIYLIHGILHLIGYDDMRKNERLIMERKQEEIFEKLLKKYGKIINNVCR